MPAYKYLSNNSDDSFTLTSLDLKIGKNDVYNGRLYCQVKRLGSIFYVDALYNLNLKFISWTANSIDVELRINDFRIREESDSSIDLCDKIINTAFLLEGVPIHIRVSNTGHILDIFNTLDLSNIYSDRMMQAPQIVEILESNPLISAFLFGIIKQETELEKVFASNIFPSLKINSQLNIESKKKRFKNIVETNITDKQILFDREKLEGAIDNIYDFNILITSRKEINKIFPCSIIYSTEEILDTNYSVFISVGMEGLSLK